MIINKSSIFNTILLTLSFHSMVLSQSIVTKESYDRRFTPPEIGLPQIGSSSLLASRNLHDMVCTDHNFHV